MDARKLADLLRTGMLRPVHHGEHGLRTLRGDAFWDKSVKMTDVELVD